MKPLRSSFQWFDRCRDAALCSRLLPAASPVTDLLVRWRAGDAAALESLIPLVYGELRSLAHHYLRQERPNHTLQSAALVHEAYVRLAGQQPPALQNRSHFFGIAARLMRQVLVDHARAARASKRGGSAETITLEEAGDLPQAAGVDVLRLDDSLRELARLDERQSRIVELRFFTGLSIDETADVMGISPATVSREWTSARAWLHRELSRTLPT